MCIAGTNPPQLLWAARQAKQCVAGRRNELSLCCAGVKNWSLADVSLEDQHSSSDTALEASR